VVCEDSLVSSVRASLATAALAATMALASAAGGAIFAGAVALVQVLFTLGSVRSVAVPSARPAAWLALAAGLGALTWVYLEESPGLTPLVAVLGPTLVVAIVIQLVRRDGRPRLTASLSLSVAACVLAMLPVMWVALRAAADGYHSVGLALFGVGLLSLTEALPISRAVRRVLGVLVAVVGGAAVVMFVGSVGAAVPAVSGVVVTAFAGVMAATAFAMVDRIADDSEVLRARAAASTRAGGNGAKPRHGRSGDTPADLPDHDDHLGSEAALFPLRMTMPLIAAAPTAYVLGRIFIG
jgi:hypothetical protein